MENISEKKSGPDLYECPAMSVVGLCPEGVLCQSGTEQLGENSGSW